MSAESALSLSMKDSEMTLAFIADAYGRCLVWFYYIPTRSIPK